MVPTLERVAREVWAYHYRIPESAYWVVGIVALVALVAVPLGGTVTLVVLFAGTLAALGIVRWRRARRRCRSALIVPLFLEDRGAKGRGVEVQTLIVDHLRRHLPSNLREMVQPIPALVTSADDQFAARLQKRMRGLLVLHGRIATQPDGTWSVYPRVLEAARRTTHRDPFTRDLTPSNPRFGPFVTSLPPTVGVRDEEFPLDFCRDLEAVMRGVAGAVAAAFDRHDEAERLLTQALAKAPGSENHQIDSLRVSLALSVAAQGRLDDAIEGLRERVKGADPSPHLLRSFAFLLTGRADAGSEGATDRDEAIEALRRALADETDPQRDMTVYNLCNQIDRGTSEYESLVDQLLAPRSAYRRLWYVKILQAIRSWNKVEEARAAANLASVREHGKEAAKWYGRTLRARPRLQFIGVVRRRPFFLLKTYERSPILYANTRDAHEAAGHRWRTNYFEWRFQRIRRRHLKIADGHLRNSDWNLAYAHFDWASAVGRHDGAEHRAKAFAVCCCWKGGRVKDGEAMWKEAAQHPDCLLGRAMLVMQLEGLGLDTSVPGDEPKDIEGVFGFIKEHYPDWVWHTEDLQFISPEEFAQMEAAEPSDSVDLA